MSEVRSPPGLFFFFFSFFVFHFLGTGDEAVGEIGSEVVYDYIDSDAKASFTFWFRFAQTDLAAI
jgi:hypothetical protein